MEGSKIKEEYAHRQPEGRQWDDVSLYDCGPKISRHAIEQIKKVSTDDEKAIYDAKKEHVPVSSRDCTQKESHETEATQVTLNSSCGGTRHEASKLSNLNEQKLSISIDHLIAVSAAAIGSSKIRGAFDKYQKALESGKIVLPVELSRETDVELQVKNLKYSLKVSELTPSKYQIRLGTQQTTVEILKIGSTGRIAVHQGRSTEYQLEETEDFYLIKIAGKNKLKFPKSDQDDASILRSPYTGKFLEYKSKAGEFLEIGDTYAQIESMKKIFDVVVKVAPGRLIPVAKEGDLISPGSILGRLEIDKSVKDQLTTSEKFEGRMNWEVEDTTVLEKVEMILDGRGSEEDQKDQKTMVEALMTQFPSEIPRLLERFINVEKDFDSREGFDESVEKIRLRNPALTSEKIVDRIHSNTKLRSKELMVKGILKHSRDPGAQIPMPLLRQLFRMRQLGIVWPVVVEVLQKTLQNQKATVEVKDSDFGASSIRIRSDLQNLKNLKTDLFSATIALANTSRIQKDKKFVANRIEFTVPASGPFLKEYEALSMILRHQIELEGVEVKEIVFKDQKKTLMRFVNEFGEFLMDSEGDQEFQKPEKRDLKRAVARQNRTTYIYDFPMLCARAVASESSTQNSWKSLISVQELVVLNDQLSIIRNPEELERRAASGANSCSVVAWILKLLDQEFVLIGNEIAYQVGSFAMPEHRLIELASKLARERKIPRINVSCNSGARIGLARDVLDVLKVKLKPNRHDFDYSYVEKREKERIGGQIVYEEREDELKLVAVKGRKIRATGEGLRHGVTNNVNTFCISHHSAAYGTLTVSIDGPAQAIIDIKNNNKGIINVSYKVAVSGKYMVSAKLDGRNIVDSPYTVYVIPTAGKVRHKTEISLVLEDQLSKTEMSHGTTYGNVENVQDESHFIRGVQSCSTPKRDHSVMDHLEITEDDESVSENSSQLTADSRLIVSKVLPKRKPPRKESKEEALKRKNREQWAARTDPKILKGHDLTTEVKKLKLKSNYIMKKTGFGRTVVFKLRKGDTGHFEEDTCLIFSNLCLNVREAKRKRDDDSEISGDETEGDAVTVSPASDKQ